MDRKRLLEMAEAEDACGGNISVGGLAHDVGFLVKPDWEVAFDDRFVLMTDNGTGPEFLFEDTKSPIAPMSIATPERIKKFIRQFVLSDPKR